MLYNIHTIYYTYYIIYILYNKELYLVKPLCLGAQVVR